MSNEMSVLEAVNWLVLGVVLGFVGRYLWLLVSQGTHNIDNIPDLDHIVVDFDETKEVYDTPRNELLGMWSLKDYPDTSVWVFKIVDGRVYYRFEVCGNFIWDLSVYSFLRVYERHPDFLRGE